MDSKIQKGMKMMKKIRDLASENDFDPGPAGLSLDMY